MLCAMRTALLVCCLVACAPPAFAKRAPKAPRATLTVEAVNDAERAHAARARSGAAIVRAQVLLDRARFSPGEIDGATGSNFTVALRGFQRRNGLEPSGALDEKTWAALEHDGAPALIEYTITADAVAGPLEKLPDDMMQKAELPALGYQSPLEALGEKFHAKPALLAALNPGRAFDREGETIAVPNIDTEPLPPVAKVLVDRSESTVVALDAQDQVLAQYPASSGSEHDPLPVGDWKILGVARHPVFHYNPDLFWDADPAHQKAEIKAGPNNPVGVVWIALSKEHYGIHGTPEPSTLGKTQSHGCIRLSNWSAAQLADAVKPGVRAVLQE
jgi:lipoprotein-anchoring transpeptidase ErfK/SrfK